MSVMTDPDRLLTMQDWEALPEDTSQRTEVVEGNRVFSPPPGGSHQRVSKKLAWQLDHQLPDELEAMQDVGVVLAEKPWPSIRIPDIVIIRKALTDAGFTKVAVAEVRLAVEIISPGSGVIDRKHKFGEYADAGIEHYWIVDLDSPASIEAYMLIDGHYELNMETAEVLTVSSPVPLRIDVRALLT
ncbi:Uma2 family endonuclease [Pseudonocardiaceae bacterium YIM PH 21723]|nr:Uma2 family endonuclease [Pseudonocardiaceae bacterium YIM PH 21723]